MKEHLLDCGCHKVDVEGNVFSRLVQFSRKGHQGILTDFSSKWRQLRPTTTVKGYLQVSIHRKSVRLNRLIAQNFIPNPNRYRECQHRDGIKKNNRVENLKWGQPKENALDRHNHGRTSRGSHRPQSKLTEDSVREIRTLRKNMTLNCIAEKFGVSKKLILLVCQGKIWRHV